MATAVATALQERQVLGVLNRRRLSELADRLGQQLRVIRHLDALGDRRLGERFLRRALAVDHRILAFDLLPLEALLGAGGVEALAVLPRRVEQATRHLGDDVGIANLERGRLEGKRAAVALDEIFADASGAVADDALGMLAQ